MQGQANLLQLCQFTEEEIENAQRVLRNKKWEEKGQVCILMGDFNAAINDSAKQFNKQAVKILEWEESGEIKILNDKQAATHVPFTKGQEQNCLDFMMITPGLEKRTIYC